MLIFLKTLYFSTCSLQMTRRWSLVVSVPLKLLALMSVLDFLAPEYVVDLMIHCYCFRHDIHCIAINKNWRSQKFDFWCLKNSPPGQFSASSNSGRYPWMLKFLLPIENYRSGSSECDFCIILILKGVTFQRQIIVPSVKQKFILSWRYFIWIYR